MPNTNMPRPRGRRRGYFCDSWFLRREMQDQNLSVPKLADLCAKRMPEIASKHVSIAPGDTVEPTRIYEMLREDYRFDERKFIQVAGGLGLDDHCHLLKRESNTTADGDR